MSPSPSPVGTPVVPNQPAPAATAATNEREENRNDTGLVNPLRGPKENKRQRRRRLAKERNEILAKEKKTAKKQKEDKKTSVSANTKAARKAIEEELRKSESISMDEFPHGYPIQAAFQSSEPSFSIYRAFSYLHSRVILQLQDELRALEDALVELDEDDYWSGRGARLTSRDFDMEEARKAFEQKAPKKASTQGSESASTTQEDNRVAVPVSERAALLDQIRIKLVEYDEILVKGREMAEFQRPSDPDWLTFRIWFWNTKPLSYEREEEFIRRKGDLITLRPRAEWGMFDDWVKSRVSNMPKLFENLFREDEPKGDTRDKSASYYSVTRIEKFTTLIIAFVIILLLAVPVFVMYRVSWNGGRGMTLLNVGLLIVFSLFFSASMSLLTRAKRAELFAASAAYSAVLIVFIGNFAGQDGGSGS